MQNPLGSQRIVFILLHINNNVLLLTPRKIITTLPDSNKRILSRVKVGNVSSIKYPPKKRMHYTVYGILANNSDANLNSAFAGRVQYQAKTSGYPIARSPDAVTPL